MSRKAVIALLLTSLLGSSGCIWPLVADIVQDPMGRHAAFDLAQRKYTNAVRWGDIEGAVRLVHPDDQREFLSYEGSFKGIRVTDFEVGETHFGENSQTATIRVTYWAYSLNTMQEKKIKEEQQWERLSAGNDWVVRPKLSGLVDQVSDLR
jgi:hypothetical protein